MSINPLPLDHIAMGLFITHLFKHGYAVNTIRTFTYAITYYHKLCCLPDPGSSFLVIKTLQGLGHLRPSVDTRLPITLGILVQLTLVLPQACSNRYEVILYRAVFALAFFGLCRISELTISPSTHTLHLSDIIIREKPPRVVVVFTTFKHSLSKQSITIYPRNSSLCPVATMLCYLSHRISHSQFLFISSSGKPVTWLQFTYMLKRCIGLLHMDPKLYTSHSFRIGGATYAAQKGLSILQIQRLGRWRSNAYLRW